MARRTSRGEPSKANEPEKAAEASGDKEREPRRLGRFVTNTFGSNDGFVAAGYRQLTAIPAAVLSAEIVIKSLKQRHDGKLQYSQIGDSTLLAIPYKGGSASFAPSSFSLQNAATNAGEPNPRALAANIFHRMLATGQTQTVLGLGCTGAGKTTQLRVVLEHLLLLSWKLECSPAVPESTLHSEILHALDIVHVFTQASVAGQSVCSSQMTESVELQHDQSGRLAGARLLDFALDRNVSLGSVLSATAGFNIFHIMVAGASPVERDAWRFAAAPGTRFATRGAETPTAIATGTLPPLSWIKTALSELGVARKVQLQLFQTLAALLHLGNIVFAPDQSKRDAPTGVRNLPSLQAAAELLRVVPDDLQAALTCRLTLVGDALCSSFLTSTQAEEARNALVTSLYELVVTWVMQTINARLSNDALPDSLVLRIVDVCSPSQLAMQQAASYALLARNYCSERLQHVLFVAQQDALRTFAARGLAADDFPEPAPHGVSCSSRFLAFMDDPRNGLVRLLGREARRAVTLQDRDVEADTGRFLDSVAHAQEASVPVEGQLTNSATFRAERTRRAAFSLQHYYGSVKYDASEFLHDDAAAIRPEFVKLFRSGASGVTGASFAQQLFGDAQVDVSKEPVARTDKLLRATSVRRRPRPVSKPVAASAAPGGAHGSLDSIGSDSGGSKADAPSRFVRLGADLDALCDAVASSERCWVLLAISPQLDEQGVDGGFDRTFVRAQIEYYGVLAWIQQSRKAPYFSIAADDLPLGGSDAPSDADQSNQIDNAVAWLAKHQIVPMCAVTPEAPWIHLSLETFKRFVAETTSVQSLRRSQNLTEEDVELFSVLIRAGGLHQMVQQSERPAATTLSPRDILKRAKQLEKDEKQRAAHEAALEKAELKLQAKQQRDREREAQRVADERARREAAPRTLTRKLWLWFTWGVSWFIPDIALRTLGGIPRAEARIAWREKWALCVIVALLSFLMVFLIQGLSLIFCPTSQQMTAIEMRQASAGGNVYVTWNGAVYSIADLVHPAPTAAAGNVSGRLYALGGTDLSPMFPRVQVSNGVPSKTASGMGLLPATCYTSNPSTERIYLSSNNAQFTIGTLDCSVSVAALNTTVGPYCHDVAALNARIAVNAVVGLRSVGQLAMSTADIGQRGGVAQGALVYYRGGVYSLASVYTYLLQLEGTFLSNTLLDALYNSRGTDLGATLAPQLLAQIDANMDCWNAAFLTAQVDTRDSLACRISSYVLLGCTILVVGIMLFKFITALFLVGSKRLPEFAHKYVICQVPCYSEGEESLLKTIDSLSLTEYDDASKLLFIIADGMVKGSGNDRPTPEILLDILGADPNASVPALPYVSIAPKRRQYSCAKVYAGWYSISARQIPYVAVIKVGGPDELVKPGNRGKRDSQMILMKFLNKVHYQAPMTPMELEVYRQIRHTVGLDPLLYEYCMMVDADTEVLPDSILRLVASCVNDTHIMGICGETVISNERKSAVTMIQVYEYYISHHLAKAFESLFGSVTCLPGCFSLYRIRCSQRLVPLLASSDLIRDYENNSVDTLHMKNLLSLGEDRYLTTIMLKHFPKYCTKFVPDARCRTTVPDELGVLLSQRRRWINSTVHNMFELLMLPDLCGCCLVSMRSIVFLDLFSTLVSPAAVAYLVYLIVSAIQHGGLETIAIVMIAASYGIQALIFMLKGQFQLLGWMLVSLLALPLFNFWLPLYAYWHFDDFSWGNTRRIAGMTGAEDDHGAGSGVSANAFDAASIPTETWAAYEKRVCGAPAAVKADLPGTPVAYKTRRFTGHMPSSYDALRLSLGLAPAASPNGSDTSSLSGRSPLTQAVALQQRADAVRARIIGSSPLAVPADMPPPIDTEMVGIDTSQATDSPIRKTHPVAAHLQNAGRRRFSTAQPLASSPAARPVDDDDDSVALSSLRQMGPTREQLQREIALFLRRSDLNHVTKRDVRAHLSSRFRVDLDASALRHDVNELIEACLYNMDG